MNKTLETVEGLEGYTQLSSHPLHKTTKPGILCLDIHPTKVGTAAQGTWGYSNTDRCLCVRADVYIHTCICRVGFCGGL